VIATLQDSTTLTSHATIKTILSLFNPPLILTSYIILSSYSLPRHFAKGLPITHLFIFFLPPISAACPVHDSS